MLPKSWVEQIFKRMGMHYGARLDTMWAGQEPAELHVYWGRELAGFQAAPEAIAHALDHLPDDKPPTLGEFKKLCVGAPRAQQLRIEAPRANADFVTKIMADMRAAAAGQGPRAWAERLKLRELQGEKLAAAQRVMWRAALAEPAKEASKTA